MAADMWAGLRVRVFNKPDFEKMLLFVKVPKTEVKRSSHKKMSRLVPDQQQILFLKMQGLLCSSVDQGSSSLTHRYTAACSKLSAMLSQPWSLNLE